MPEPRERFAAAINGLREALGIQSTNSPGEDLFALAAAADAIRRASHLADEWRSWTPTVDNINALPEPVRAYVVAMATDADPAATIRELVVAKDQVAALSKLVDEQDAARQVMNDREARYSQRINALEAIVTTSVDACATDLNDPRRPRQWHLLPFKIAELRNDVAEQTIDYEQRTLDEADLIRERRQVTPSAADLDKAAESLVKIVYLYGHYKVKYRSVIGCLTDALEIIAPEVIAEIRAGDDWSAWDQVYEKRWSDDEDGA